MVASRVAAAAVLWAAARLFGQPAEPDLCLSCDGIRSGQLVAQADKALLAKQPATAVRLLRESQQACPADTTVLLHLSRALTADRQHTAAEAAARSYLRTEPNSPQGLLALANALFMAQRWEECAPVLERLVKVSPKNVAALLLQANNYYMLGDTPKAEQVLLDLLDTHPQDVDAAYMLGRIYYMDNRADYAAGLFQRVVRVDPDHYKAWDNLALCHEAMGEPELAIRHFLKAISLVEKTEPNYDWPYANLADLLIRQNRYDEAYRAASSAAERNPYSARNFYLGGKALVKLERTADAAKWLERAAALDPSYPEALYALSRVYLQTGQKDRAMDVLEQFRKAKANAPAKRR